MQMSGANRSVDTNGSNGDDQSLPAASKEVDPYSLREFLRTNDKLLPALSLFTALTVFARGVESFFFSYALSFLFLATTIILYVELRSHFPPSLQINSVTTRFLFLRSDPGNRLLLFSIVLDLSLTTIIVYSAWTYLYIWIAIFIAIAAYITAYLSRNVIRHTYVYVLGAELTTYRWMGEQKHHVARLAISSVIMAIATAVIQSLGFSLIPKLLDIPHYFTEMADVLAYVTPLVVFMAGMLAGRAVTQWGKRRRRLEDLQLRESLMKESASLAIQEAERIRSMIERQLDEERREAFAQRYAWRQFDRQRAIASAGSLTAAKELLSNPSLDIRAKEELRVFLTGAGEICHQGRARFTDISILELPRGYYSMRATFEGCDNDQGLEQ